MSLTTAPLAYLNGYLPHAVRVARIQISGQVDVATAPAVAAACRRAVRGGSSPCLEVDLHALEFCDAAGLSVFVTIDAELRSRGGAVRLVEVPRRTQKLLRISSLEHLLG